DGPAHGPPEAAPTPLLLGHALREQGGVGLRTRIARGLIHVLDLDVHPLPGDPFQVLADPFHLRALAPDDDAGASRPDERLDLVTASLDVDGRDAGTRQPAADVSTDPDVLVQGRRVVAPCVPVRLPRVDHPEAESVRINLVAHL